MKKASEYRQHARECRDLAAQMGSSEQRQQLMQMAEDWDRMAIDRVDLITRNPDLAHPGDLDEEAGPGR